MLGTTNIIVQIAYAVKLIKVFTNNIAGNLLEKKLVAQAG
jgi:hypothetical protein